jgi:DNA-binding NarL/FixJ family response regulator
MLIAPPLTDEIRVVLVDDHELLRGGMRAMLEAQEDITVVGEAGDGAEGVEVALATHPDVVVMDLGMPRLDGVEAMRRLRVARSRARILVVTGADHAEVLSDVMAAGAVGFIAKDEVCARLPEAVRIASTGDRVVSPIVTDWLIDGHLESAVGHRELQSRFDDLTPRELDIMRLLTRGMSNSDVSRTVHLSEATVKTHVTRILGKLGVASRVQAVVLAYESGFVRPGNVDAETDLGYGRFARAA